MHGCKGRTLPTIRWQASREGVCLVGARVCFDREMKTHTESSGGRKKSARANLWKSPAGMQKKLTKETYPGPLLVNIKLIYPYRE